MEAVEQARMAIQSSTRPSSLQSTHLYPHTYRLWLSPTLFLHSVDDCFLGSNVVTLPPIVMGKVKEFYFKTGTVTI